MSTKKPASEDAMNELHDTVARELKTILTEGEIVEVAGQYVRKRPSASMLNVIRAFLRDNNVRCAADHPSRPVGDLKRSMEEILGNLEDSDIPKFN